jgi:hypothetical protein
MNAPARVKSIEATFEAYAARVANRELFLANSRERGLGWAIILTRPWPPPLVLRTRALQMLPDPTASSGR